MQLSKSLERERVRAREGGHQGTYQSHERKCSSASDVQGFTLLSFVLTEQIWGLALYAKDVTRFKYFATLRQKGAAPGGSHVDGMGTGGGRGEAKQRGVVRGRGGRGPKKGEVGRSASLSQFVAPPPLPPSTDFLLRRGKEALSLPRLFPLPGATSVATTRKLSGAPAQHTPSRTHTWPYAAFHPTHRPTSRTHMPVHSSLTPTPLPTTRTHIPIYSPLKHSPVSVHLPATRTPPTHAPIHTTTPCAPPHYASPIQTTPAPQTTATSPIPRTQTPMYLPPSARILATPSTHPPADIPGYARATYASSPSYLPPRTYPGYLSQPYACARESTHNTSPSPGSAQPHTHQTPPHAHHEPPSPRTHSYPHVHTSTMVRAPHAPTALAENAACFDPGTPRHHTSADAAGQPRVIKGTACPCGSAIVHYRCSGGACLWTS